MSRTTFQLTEEEFQTLLSQLDLLVQQFESLPYPQIQARVFDLIQIIDAVHRAGLGRLVDFLHEADQAELIERATEDPIIHTLLVLYDLVPAETLPLRPEPTRPVRNGNFISVDQLLEESRRWARRPVFREVAGLAEVPVGTVRHFQVDGIDMLVANVAGEIYAVRDYCPHQKLPLRDGNFSPPVIVCPWHNEAYDIRSGQRIDGATGPGLAVLPVTVTDNIIKVANKAGPGEA